MRIVQGVWRLFIAGLSQSPTGGESEFGEETVFAVISFNIVSGLQQHVVVVVDACFIR